MSAASTHVEDLRDISDADFSLIAGLVHDMTGIDLQPHKKTMVASRLTKRLRATGTRSARDYCDFLQSDRGREERTKFISAYTTNMTRFNREDHHFTHLAQAVLPRLAQTARQGGRVRIWSAGCSSGEEPYQLAFHMLEACPEADTLDIRILATDIDTEILSFAQAGIYPRSHTATLPGEQMTRFFAETGAASDRMSVAQKARDLIVFRPLNLHHDWPFKGQFDVIMCRNVTIYFNTPDQTRLWRRFTQRLVKGGMLYIGHSESFGEECIALFDALGIGIFQRNATVASDTAMAAAIEPGGAS